MTSLQKWTWPWHRALPRTAPRSTWTRHCFARIDAVQQSTGGGPEPEPHLRRSRPLRHFVPRPRSQTDRRRYADIVAQLAELYPVCAERAPRMRSEWVLWLPGEADLAGLSSASLRDAARCAAQARGKPDGYAITLSRSSVVPFLTSSERRDLREQAFSAWSHAQGAHAGLQRQPPACRGHLAAARRASPLALATPRLPITLVDRMCGQDACRCPQPAHAGLEVPACARMREDEAALDALRISHGCTEPWPDGIGAGFAEGAQARFDLDDAEVKPYLSWAPRCAPCSAWRANCLA